MKLVEAIIKANNKNLYLKCLDSKKMVVKNYILYDTNNNPISTVYNSDSDSWEVRKIVPKITFVKAMKALIAGKNVRSLNSEWEYKICKDELLGKCDCDGFEKATFTEAECEDYWEIL